jgi:3-hydroxybutyryl-CoA dehydratase
MAQPTVSQSVYFENVAVGTSLPTREHGPLTIVDTVRWAGLQENWQRLHFDRDHVREHNGLRTFIASGAYRQALLMRLITDWLGPRGQLRKLSLRHTYSTFEGDRMRFAGTVADKSLDAADPWLDLDLRGHNQDDRQILTGRCTVLLPSRERANAAASRG